MALGLAVAAAAGLITATGVKLAVSAVHHVVVLRHCRRLGRAGDAPSDLRDSPAGSPIVSSANLYAIAPAAPGPNTTFVAPAGTFYRGGAVATVAMCGSSCIFVCTVLQVVEHFREARRVHHRSGRLGAGDDWTYRCERAGSPFAMLITSGPALPPRQRPSRSSTRPGFPHRQRSPRAALLELVGFV